MRKVAALYVDPRGHYLKMRNVDCWDLARNAFWYEGPVPVVAHPPCGAWSSLKHLYTGNDRGLALRAVHQVRKFGGVLEHPARSGLWASVANLPKPGEPADKFGGVTVEVCQCDWGHPARKRTWLYCVRVDRALLETRPPPRVPTHWCSGGRTRRPGMGATVPRGIKVCSAQQRRRTPPLFAEWLVALARSVT